MLRQPGFWSVDDRLRELSAQGDPLEKLSEIVDFELFRPVLDEAFPIADRSKGGRPPFDAVLKFKMLYLQAQHGLSFEQTEHLVRDRLSWMRFCGLSIADPVPDANTLWDFREALIAKGALEHLFERLDQVILIFRRKTPPLLITHAISSGQYRIYRPGSGAGGNISHKAHRQ